jgi:hypothetical protein
LEEVVQALKAKVAELKKDSADEIGEMQELVKHAQAAAEAAASRNFALDPNLLEKRANGVTCPSTEKMALLSQQVLAGRMSETHVMESLHMAFVFFTGREPPPEAIPSTGYVHSSSMETYQLAAELDAFEIRTAARDGHSMFVSTDASNKKARHGEAVKVLLSVGGKKGVQPKIYELATASLPRNPGKNAAAAEKRLVKEVLEHVFGEQFNEVDFQGYATDSAPAAVEMNVMLASDTGLNVGWQSGCYQHLRSNALKKGIEAAFGGRAKFDNGDTNIMDPLHDLRYTFHQW